MNDVFLLGTGFSKAVYSQVPLLNELTNIIKVKFQNYSDTTVGRGPNFVKGTWAWFIERTGLQNNGNFEDILTLLYQEFPWKTQEQYHWQHALYLHLISIIRDEFLAINEAVKGLSTPSYFSDFIKYIHKKKVPIITFNYDTILEDLAIKIISKDFDGRVIYKDIYEIPVRTHIFRNYGVDTFKLFKLHGSINWYVYNYEDTQGEQIYIVDYETIAKDDKDIADLSPIILPPVLDKSKFFAQGGLLAQWQKAAAKLRVADRLIIIGYSLPFTDVTTRLMIQTSLNPNAKVIIVNKSVPEDQKERYRSIFGDRLDETHIDTGFSEKAFQYILPNESKAMEGKM